MMYWGRFLRRFAWGSEDEERLQSASAYKNVIIISRMPRIFRIIFPVSDIERAGAFYGAVLQEAGERVSAGRHYFRCGGVILACFDPRRDGDDFDPRANQEHVYFAVIDLEGTLRRVETAGGEIVSGIQTQPWGERGFYARDPFGNPICFVQEGTTFGER